MRRLYLVDAHSYLHRAYHALPPLTNSAGLPVGALYGFARMLLKLIREHRPEAACVCFDSPGPTFRHKLYPAYKANRREIDPDLKTQLALSRELAEALGFDCQAAPGYEADDLMARLARDGRAEGLEAVLVTSDKDILQMVGPGIKVFNAAKESWVDAEAVKKKFGVAPDRIVEYLALVGDSADNVPGVRGIGPVGAKKLLGRFGTLGAALEAARRHDPGIPAKTATALLDSTEDLGRAMELLHLKEDAPLERPAGGFNPPHPDEAKLREVLGRLEFRSLLEEILSEGAGNGKRKKGNASSPSPVSHFPPHEKSAVLEESFLELQKHLAKSKFVVVTGFSLDNKTPLLEDAAESYLCVGTPEGKFSLLDAAGVSSHSGALKKILGGRALKSVYDLKETLRALARAGLELSDPVFDARLAEYCLNPLEPRRASIRPDGKDVREALTRRLARALDPEGARERLKEADVLEVYESIELPLVPALIEMEDTGLALDAALLKRVSGEFQSEIESLQKEIERLGGQPVNVNSPKQLSSLLFDVLKLPVGHKTEKGDRSTDEDALRELASRHPVVGHVLRYRELSKLKSTYVDGLLERMDPGTGRIHTRLDQAGTETGRLSSAGPNLQNIPVRTPDGQKIRRAFKAGHGNSLVSADYSQIDLRVLAHVSGDPVLKDAFERGDDVHTRTACEVYGVGPREVTSEMRRVAKAVNFGLIYGQGAYSLSHDLGISREEASRVIERYFARYGSIRQWIDKNLASARETGRVRTFLGRVRLLPDLAAKNSAVRAYAERMARNTPIQGGSADIIKVAMLKVWEGLRSRAKRYGARLLLQIHDELLFEVPRPEVRPFARWVRGAMEGAVSLSVPLVVDVKAGPNWQEMEKCT